MVRHPISVLLQVDDAVGESVEPSAVLASCYQAYTGLISDNNATLSTRNFCVRDCYQRNEPAQWMRVILKLMKGDNNDELLNYQPSDRTDEDQYISPSLPWKDQAPQPIFRRLKAGGTASESFRARQEL